MGNCHPLEFVGRDSETQLEVGEFFFFFLTFQGLMNFFPVFVWRFQHGHECKREVSLTLTRNT